MFWRFLIVAIFVSHNLSAQTAELDKEANKPATPVRPNSIKVDPLALPFQMFSIKYERLLKPNIGIQLGYAYVGGSDYLNSSRGTGTGWFGSIITGEFRYYYKEKYRTKKVTVTDSEYRKELRNNKSGVVKKKSKRKHSKTYMSPYIRYQTLEHNDFNNVKVPMNTFGGGFLVGKLVNLNEWLVLDYYIGINYQSGLQDLKNSGGSVDWLGNDRNADLFAPKAWFGWGPRAGISIGVQF